MRGRITALILTLLMLGLSSAKAAEGFSILHEFSGEQDGFDIFNRLISFNDQLLGTAVRGGKHNKGVLFSIDKDGNNFKALHHFDGSNGRSPFNLGAIVGTSIYGVTRSDEINYSGVLYSYDLETQEFEIQHRFTGDTSEGGHLMYSPIIFNGSLYGTTNKGGQFAGGTLYRFDLDTKSLSTLIHFSDESGDRPFGGLLYHDGWLIGMTSDITLRTVNDPANTKHGTIFRVRPDGTEFEVVYRFQGGELGGHPYGNLVSDGKGKFFGTTLGEYNNLDDQGVVFSIDEDFHNYKVIHVFGSIDADGSKPNGDVVYDSKNSVLYGVTHSTLTAELSDDGPAFGTNIEAGTLFSLRPDGSDFKILHIFSDTTNGVVPQRTPILLNNTLFGTTAFGGSYTTDDRPFGMGLVYKYQLPLTDASIETNTETSTQKTETSSVGGLSGGLLMLLTFTLLVRRTNNYIHRHSKNLKGQ